MLRPFSRAQFILSRAADSFSAPMDRLSCAGQSLFLHGIRYPTNGICERQTEQRKNKGWQDRLPPVLGAVWNALLPNEHRRSTRSDAPVHNRARVDALFGHVAAVGNRPAVDWRR